MRLNNRFIIPLFLVLCAGALFAMEKDGLRVEVVPELLSDSSLPQNTMADSTPVHEEMSLKASFRNTSMHDAPEGTIEYIVLVQRWGTEVGTYSSYKGSEKLEPIRFGQQVEIDIGKYQIGGHLHGGSDRHKDKLAGWKIVVTQGAKRTEFAFPQNFDALSASAKPAKAEKSR